MATTSQTSLQQLRANEQKAWEAIYPDLWRISLAAIRAATGPSLSDIENVAAEVIVKTIIPGVLTPNSDSFNQMATLDDLFKMTAAISRNRAIDALRRSIRRPETLMAVVPENGTNQPSHTTELF